MGEWGTTYGSAQPDKHIKYNSEPSSYLRPAQCLARLFVEVEEAEALRLV